MQKKTIYLTQKLDRLERIFNTAKICVKEKGDSNSNTNNVNREYEIDLLIYNLRNKLQNE